MDVMSSLLVVASSEEADGGDAIGANASTEIARRAADTNLSDNILIGGGKDDKWARRGWGRVESRKSRPRVEDSISLVVLLTSLGTKRRKSP